MPTSKPIHPGEHLAEFLEELGITQHGFAMRIEFPQVRISDIVHSRMSITADMALRLGRALGTTYDFWLNLQRMYDQGPARAETDVSAIPSLEDTSG